MDYKIVYNNGWKVYTLEDIFGYKYFFAWFQSLETKPMKMMKMEAKVDSDAECMICELIVKEMRSGLSQNATQVQFYIFY